MFSLYNALKQSSLNSKIGVKDINPETFFGRMISSDIGWSSALEYINNLISGFYESEFKLVVVGGSTSKATTAAIDCMLDTESVCERYIDSFDSYEALIKHYTKRADIFGLYLIYKEYDAETTETTFVLTRILQELE